MRAAARACRPSTSRPSAGTGAGTTCAVGATCFRDGISRLAAMNVAQAVARALYQGGVRTSFGVLGSGNFLLANALREAGVDVHTARHENNAMCMADGYGRASGRVAVCTTHQGPGFTNALT